MEMVNTSSVINNNSPAPRPAASLSFWQDALRRLLRDPWAVFSFIVIAIYAFIALGTSFGILASGWQAEVGPSYSPPSAEYWLGTDIFGRSVMQKVLQGTAIAMNIGLITALFSAVIGTALGALAGYYGGKVDEVIQWFYTTVTSIPNIMLLISITLVLGKGITSLYIALVATSWVGLCRVVRGEVIKHKDREYVHAAAAIGASNFRRLFIHIIPNVMHVVIINFSMTFQTAIKSEVILSYLGLGVQGRPSWGTMIDDAKLELARDVWWQLTGATLFMLFIVLAFNILSDSLRDALDPKLKGK